MMRVGVRQSLMRDQYLVVVLAIIMISVSACQRTLEEENHEWKAGADRQQISSQTIPLEKRVEIASKPSEAQGAVASTTTTTLPFRFVNPNSLPVEESQTAPSDPSSTSVKTSPETQPPVPPPAPVKKYADLPDKYNKEQDFFTPSVMHPTIYYKPILEQAEDSCDKSELKTIYNSDGNALYEVCPKVYHTCTMQGSCVLILADRLAPLNYFGHEDKKFLFFEFDMSQCPYSFGVRNICLDPYYSVAADSDLYSPGDVIYVPAVAGTKLPTGGSHSGFFIVRDIGKAIQGEGRFDFFTGFIPYASQDNPFKKIGLGDKTKSFRYYRVTGAPADRMRSQRAFPLLPPAMLTAESTGNLQSNIRNSVYKEIVKPAPEK